MTTMQPILALRHVYEPAVQLCRTDSVVSAMANSTLGSPHHHLLRKGECAGLETRSNPSSPTACCSQGKVRLPPPPQPNLEYRQLLQGSDSEAKAFRENARSYNNALSFTSLAALWDQTQVGTLGPPVFRVFGRLYHRLGALIPAVNQCPTFAQTWLINPAEATDTRLEPDGADIHMQRSTLTKLESMLRTKNHFVREFASAKPRAAQKWRCLSAIPTPTREIVDRKTLFSRCTVIDVPMVGPSTKSLARSIRKMASTPTFLFAGSTKPGCQLPETESRSTMVSNCASYLPVLVWMTKRMVMVNAALGPNDKACNRPDLIARVFEAKSGNKRHAGCFGDECRMNGFGFFAVLRIVNPTGDRIAFLQSLDINVPVASHGTYLVEDPVPMSLANRMGASFHFTNYAAEVREQTIFRAATAEAPELIFDTGATTSLVNDKCMLSDYATLDFPIFMIDAAGTRTPAVGRGTLTAEFALADGTTSKMTIADVLHVPNFVVNLISGPSLCKQGVRIEMEEGRCEFSKDGQTFAIAQLVGSKYIFQARLSNLNPTEAQSLTVSVRSNSADREIWHQRFGHLNMPYLLEMERKETVMGLSIKGEDFDVAKCHGCMQGRGVHANISKGPASRADKPLHAIHADLWGPVRHESFAGEVMVLGLVDDYSRFRWSFPIGKKSSVTALVVELIQRVERSRDCNVAIFHSDNGREFVNNSLKAFFRERGIEHRTTVPYAHYQNGVIERGWRTMFETVRIWLLVSGLPLSFWAFAATAFTYVSNRRPTAALPGSTPFKMYHLLKPNVSRFRVWGCVAYVRIAPERRASKIEPPRVKARFIGYAEQGWMFWRPDTNTVFVSDDANFDESSFELHRGNSDDADLREDSPTTLFGDPPTRSLDIDGDDAVEQDFSLDGAGRAQAPGTDDRATAPIAARRAFAPDGNSRDNTPPPVGRARAPDREYTPAAPGCERAPGDRVQHSNGQELTPIVPTRRAPAPVVSNGRAPAPVAPNGRAPAPVVPNGRAPAPVAGDGGAPPPVASRRPSPFLDDDADNDPPDLNPIPDGYEPVVPTTERTSELAERWGAPAGSRRRGGAEQQAMFVDLGTILGDVIPLNELPEWEQVLSVVVNLEECNGWTNLSSIVQGSTEGICGIEELEAYQVWTRGTQPELPQKLDTESNWDLESTHCNSLAAVQRSKGNIFKAGIAFGSQNDSRVRLAVDIIESRYPALQMWPPTLLVVKQILATKIANVAKSFSTRATKRRKGLNDNVTASDSASAKSFEVMVDDSHNDTKTRIMTRSDVVLQAFATFSGGGGTLATFAILVARSCLTTSEVAGHICRAGYLTSMTSTAN
ncbi:BQ5605_C004g02611 [Microbotryum silenes-dioicae]|uniref:BQ5605_C004g02611 protein n=1 Tax=Microbotryum silenes-dioicae TaxID=796604 RepID=A0A2X0P3W9_9BASI|nr:BQ5605_C004g02611 [Microbotryum silenes-dioicae]